MFFQILCINEHFYIEHLMHLFDSFLLFLMGLQLLFKFYQQHHLSNLQFIKEQQSKNLHYHFIQVEVVKICKYFQVNNHKLLLIMIQMDYILFQHLHHSILGLDNMKIYKIYLNQNRSILQLFYKFLENIIKKILRKNLIIIN